MPVTGQNSGIPVSGLYHGYKITSVSPPSGGGIILLQVLGMIEPHNLKQMGFHTWRSVHLLAESEKRAFADRSQYLGDPDYTEVPVKELLDTNYLFGRMKDYSEDAATPSQQIAPGSMMVEVNEETTHYSVVDNMGNAVAATTTLNGGFGNSIVVDSAGFLMNNQMDDFSLKPGTPNMYGLTGGEANSIGPGKRMLSSMTPVIVEKEWQVIHGCRIPGRLNNPDISPAGNHQCDRFWNGHTARCRYRKISSPMAS